MEKLENPQNSTKWCKKMKKWGGQRSRKTENDTQGEDTD